MQAQTVHHFLFIGLFTGGIVLQSAHANDTSSTQNTESETTSLSSQRAVVLPYVKEKSQPVTYQRRAITPATTPIEEQPSITTPSDRVNGTSDITNNSSDTVVANPITPTQITEQSLLSPTVLAENNLALLTVSDLDLAQKAYNYVKWNWQESTGFVNSVDGYPHTTMWDVASALAAVLALEQLSLMPTDLTTQYIKKMLDTLQKMPLYKQQLPNRQYSAKTGKPSGKMSSSKLQGNGWSALDIGRLLIWLDITKQYRPEFAQQVNTIKSQWSLNQAAHNNNLFGEKNTGETQFYRQEGRLGYLQYAQKGYQIQGIPVDDKKPTDDIKKISIEKTDLYVDDRNLPFFTLDPYVLYQIEFGFTDEWWDQLLPLYELHEEQYKKNNQLWFFSEDAMNRAPWFSYNNIFYHGKNWYSTDPSGTKVNNPQVFSNKVAFSLSIIFQDELSNKANKEVIKTSQKYKSIPTGKYLDGTINTSFNINTQSLVLTSLWYKVRNNTPLYTYKHTGG